ncbi:GNAT family N-acetyltransferase [Nonomuraea sp. NPDC050643]|uniref:GNAT family N-acetyltransferase n=1 Tax=Nonomuraea sp. NPDC050643 TaxID=3155660 RepID=UPI003410C33A
MGLDIVVAEALESVRQQDWDRLVTGDDFYLSHGWLRTLEDDPRVGYHYVLAVEDGVLAGALPIFDIRVEGSGFYAPERHHRALTGGGRWLLAGGRRAYHGGVLLPGDEPRRRSVLRALLEAGLRLAAERDARGLVWMFAPTPITAELCDEGAVAAFDTVEACLAADGWDAYLAGLSARRRRNTARERRRFEQAGYDLAEQPLGECWPELAELVANVQHKYGHRSTSESMRRVLAPQVRLLDGRSVAFTARRDGRLVAGALRYRFGDTLYARMVGFDYARLRNAFEYFNLAYYVPIQYMQRTGLRRLHLGIESAHTKAERGARLQPLWTVALPCDGSRLVPADRTGAARREWTDRYDERVLPPEHWDVPW